MESQLLKVSGGEKLAADKNSNYAIAYTDISQLKSYNALYGWSAGQRILEMVIETLSQEVDGERELLPEAMEVILYFL